MKRIKTVAFALLTILCSGAASAQQNVTIDFYGESTFRGYYGGIEHDNPIASSSNGTAGVATDTLDGSWYANTPRRIVERLIADGLPVTPYNAARANYAVSGTPVDNILNGGTGNGGKGVAALSGATEGAIAVINTGLNDALIWSTSSISFQDTIWRVVDRLIRTGKKVVILRPNLTNNDTANLRLNSYYDNLANYLYGQNTQVFDSRNIRIVFHDVTADPAAVRAPTDNTTRPADGTHPNNFGYESLGWAVYTAIPQSPSFLTNAANERVIAQDYILFFNRAVESGGADYWLGQLNQYGEAYIAQSMYSVAPEYQGLSASQIATKFYGNLLGKTPDEEGLAYWTVRINSVGVGQTAVEFLNAVRSYNYVAVYPPNATDAEKQVINEQARQKQLLVHRTNVGVAYGFRLKKSAVDTSGMMSGVTTDPASVFAATQYK